MNLAPAKVIGLLHCWLVMIHQQLEAQLTSPGQTLRGSKSRLSHHAFDPQSHFYKVWSICTIIFACCQSPRKLQTSASLAEKGPQSSLPVSSRHPSTPARYGVKDLYNPDKAVVELVHV
jgi:hypothetical protein